MSRLPSPFIYVHTSWMCPERQRWRPAGARINGSRGGECVRRRCFHHAVVKAKQSGWVCTFAMSKWNNTCYMWGPPPAATFKHSGSDTCWTHPMVIKTHWYAQDLDKLQKPYFFPFETPFICLLMFDKDHVSIFWATHIYEQTKQEILETERSSFLGRIAQHWVQYNTDIHLMALLSERHQEICIQQLLLVSSYCIQTYD